MGVHRIGPVSLVAKTYQSFTPEFREEASKMVVDGSRPIAQVSRELGVDETTSVIGSRRYREKHADDEPPLQFHLVR